MNEIRGMNSYGAGYLRLFICRMGIAKLSSGLLGNDELDKLLRRLIHDKGMDWVICLDKLD